MEKQIISEQVAVVLWYVLYFECGVIALIGGYIATKLRQEKKRIQNWNKDVDTKA